MAMQLSELRSTLRRMEDQLRQSEESAERLKMVSMIFCIYGLAVSTCCSTFTGFLNLPIFFTQDNDSSGKRTFHLESQLAAVSDTCKEYEHAASEIKGEICRLHKQVEGLCYERDSLSKKLSKEQNESERLSLLVEEVQQKAKLDVG